MGRFLVTFWTILGTKNGAKNEPINQEKPGWNFDVVLNRSWNPKWVILKALDLKIQVFRLGEVHFRKISQNITF